MNPMEKQALILEPQTLVKMDITQEQWNNLKAMVLREDEEDHILFTTEYFNRTPYFASPQIPGVKSADIIGCTEEMNPLAIWAAFIQEQDDTSYLLIDQGILEDYILWPGEEIQHYREETASNEELAVVREILSQYSKYLKDGVSWWSVEKAFSNTLREAHKKVLQGSQI